MRNVCLLVTLILVTLMLAGYPAFTAAEAVLVCILATDASKQNGPTYTKPDGTQNYEAAFSDFFYDAMVSGVNKMMSVGTILASPVVVDKVIYFGSADGNLYALM